MINRFFSALRSTKTSDTRLSVIVISYNMKRELPRTLETLSASMQLDISEDDYEIIVVDNGSSVPADEEYCSGLGRNIRLATAPNPTASPAGAIAYGVSLARYDCLGIWIDGARMASPGLLSLARTALGLGPQTVVGTIGFHLGPKVQMESVHEGYDQAEEDRLLSSAGWREDGYRLFDVSCLAGSSARGWFVLPQETNALFMHKRYYEALGGYDEKFQSPGGGLINHDIWNRVCEAGTSNLIMLLGEGTFHQVHGGVATNSLQSPWDGFVREYENIRGKPYRRAEGPFRVFGTPRAL